MRKETLVFLTSLAIIFIIGYVNMTMMPENVFNDEDYAQVEEGLQSDVIDNDITQIVGDETDNNGGIELVEVLEQTDKTDITVNPSTDVPTLAEIEDMVKGVHEEASEEPADVATTDEPGDVATTEDPVEEASAEEEAAVAEVVEEEPDYVILGDITNILENDSVVANANGVLDMLNSSFSNFKLNKEKGNQDVIDHLEKSISNESISADTKNQFEALLLNKTELVEAEQNIEIMLQTKGYNETVVIVDDEMVKVVTNETIEQADATKILDVIVSETNYEPAQIKIVKFDNIDL
ncbi:MAG: SpoIIIAH-like protein [Sedimentibacter sp.]|nr:SpoIIIAH-like protein [Sedimentibacter sp.]